MGIDLKNGYPDLLPHIGHKIACVGYGAGYKSEPPDNVAIECETCGEVLIDFDFSVRNLIPPDDELFNDKPMSHWREEAKKLVVLVLTMEATKRDTRSIIGNLAHKRLLELAMTEDADEVKKIFKHRQRFEANVARVLSDITGSKGKKGCDTKTTKRRSTAKASSRTKSSPRSSKRSRTTRTRS